MAEESKTPRPQMNFATMDDDADVSVKSSGRTAGLSGRHFSFGHDNVDLDDDTVSSWMLPIGLILLWLVILLVEMVFFDTDANGLRRLPVAMGAASQISILKPMTAWVAKIMMAHKFLGALMFIFDRILLLLVLAISSICSGFMHATMMHWLGNSILLLICSGVAFLMHYPLGRLLKKWLIASGLGIGVPWIIMEFASFIAQGSHNHNSFLWIWDHATEPIVGASVGLYALVGFLIVTSIKNIRTSKWAPLVTIGLIVLALALLVSRWMSLGGVDKGTMLGATLLMTVIMHFSGFIIGLIQGVHDRYQLY